MRFSVPALVLSLCATLAATSPVPEPNTDVDKSKVYIEGITYAGSGCKAGTVAVANTDDWKTVTLSFDSYIASIGPKVPFSEKRKNCNINVKLHYPPGYQYTFYQTDYTGYGELEKGVSGLQQSDYWFAGFANQKATLRSFWWGPQKGQYNFRDTLANEAFVWSPCGASTTLNINTQLALDNSKNPHGNGLLTTDVIDHKVSTKYAYGLQWRKC